MRRDSLDEDFYGDEAERGEVWRVRVDADGDSVLMVYLAGRAEEGFTPGPEGWTHEQVMWMAGAADRCRPTDFQSGAA